MKEEQTKKDQAKQDLKDAGQAGGDAAVAADEVVNLGLVEDPEQNWKQYCHTLVRSHVNLTVEPKSEARFADFIKTTQLYKIFHARGPDKIAVLFDVKMNGESKWQPNVRVASLREDSYERVICGAMLGFMPVVGDGQVQPPLEVMPNHLFMIWDGFKHGLESDLLRPFKADNGKKLDAVKRTIFITMDPISLANRRQQQWDAKHKSTVEFMHVLSSLLVVPPPDQQNGPLRASLAGQV